MSGANGSRECAPDDKLRDTHQLHLMEMMGFAGSTHPTYCCSRRAGTTRHDLLIQFLIHDLDRAIDLGTGHAKLMRDQLHQQVDPLDERRSTGYRAGRG